MHGDVVAADHALFATRAEALSSAATALCAAPSAGTLDAAGEAWWAACEPWKRLDWVGFGPVVDEPTRYGPLIDFWPVRDTVVDDLLAGSDPLTLEAVQALGSSALGLPVSSVCCGYGRARGPSHKR